MSSYPEVVAALQRGAVRFVVGGGVAGVLYGVPRATFDLDVLLPPDESNCAAALKTLLLLTRK
ncbi:MAG: hypothetical protein HYZ28_11880 [Myxococcales bacterium]|nr:hypothetical protein [Myxococcales bacterium]